MTKTISIKKYVGVGLLAGLFVFIGLYTVWETKSLSKGVNLQLSGITDGASVSSDVVSLQGSAFHASHITIDGREIEVDKDDNFTEELVLSPGYNIITVEARDKFNKKTQNTYRVFYKGDAETTTALK
jgi:hypothetical protein